MTTNVTDKQEYPKKVLITDIVDTKKKAFFFGVLSLYHLLCKKIRTTDIHTVHGTCPYILLHN